MHGKLVDLSHALVTADATNSHSPRSNELVLRSPREGPLLWDPEQRRWLNNPNTNNQQKPSDLAMLAIDQNIATKVKES